jgi:serine/threonine protein kinase
VNPHELIGTEVAGYRIEAVLGAGAMGVVYVAQQRSPERHVALKVIAPAFAHDETFRRRFLREVDAAAAIEHPHILPVYEGGQADGTLFMATRLVDGTDLREILAASGTLAVDRTVAIVGQVGEALDAAHARGLIHRDVKPGNILVTHPSGSDFAYLTDFGVSTWTASTAATITATGRMVGTADYVAPEHIEGGPIDGRADVYSLGCVLYECLTGRPPFSGRGPAATLYAHIHERPEAPSSIDPHLPPSFDAVLDRALQKPPDERFASCRQMSDELRAVLDGRAPAQRAESARPHPAVAPDDPTVSVPTSTRAARSRKWSPWTAGIAASVVALLAVGVGALIAVSTRDHPRTPTPTGPSPALIRGGVQVAASHTSPSSHDAAGHPVTYVPANVIDGDVQTAWRTEGDGRGAWVTLIFDNPIDIVRIGLIPGYAKTDPATGANRFEQDRIITSVRYAVPGKPPITKEFRPLPVPQYARIDTTTSRITVRITGTTESGGLDYTAISEIYVYGYRQ